MSVATNTTTNQDVQPPPVRDGKMEIDSKFTAEGDL